MSSHSIRVWDLPTRIFHWALAACVAGAYISVKVGGLWMDWHVRFGLAVLALLIFRLVWGFAGPRYARFGQFVRGPSTVFAYLRGKVPHTLGHNPLGACSVIALLLVLGVQAGSGLFANDDIITTGPLAYLDDTWSARLTALHNLNEWPIIVLVAMHVAAIFWYQFRRRQNLIGPMVTGDTVLRDEEIGALDPAQAHARDNLWLRLAALVLLLAISAGVWWLTTLEPVGDYSFM